MSGSLCGMVIAVMTVITMIAVIAVQMLIIVADAANHTYNDGEGGERCQPSTAPLTTV